MLVMGTRTVLAMGYLSCKKPERLLIGRERQVVLRHAGFLWPGPGLRPPTSPPDRRLLPAGHVPPLLCPRIQVDCRSARGSFGVAWESQFGPEKMPTAHGPSACFTSSMLKLALPAGPVKVPLNSAFPLRATTWDLTDHDVYPFSFSATSAKFSSWSNCPCNRPSTTASACSRASRSTGSAMAFPFGAAVSSAAGTTASEVAVAEGPQPMAAASRLAAAQPSKQRRYVCLCQSAGDCRMVPSFKRYDGGLDQ